MRQQLRPAVLMFLLLTLITGAAYPFVVTVIARVAFPTQSAGSLLAGDAGSSLIGQPFDDPRYFWSRLSATVDGDGKPLPYNAANSSGSNLSPTNSAWTDAVKARVDALKAVDPANTRPIPIDLVTASASGLDPHISPAAAEYQIARVAAARHTTDAVIRTHVLQCTESRQLGVLGEPRVNVLQLNIALDRDSK